MIATNNIVHSKMIIYLNNFVAKERDILIEQSCALTGNDYLFEQCTKSNNSKIQFQSFWG